jgi:hypothetical protein
LLAIVSKAFDQSRRERSDDPTRQRAKDRDQAQKQDLSVLESLEYLTWLRITVLNSSLVDSQSIEHEALFRIGQEGGCLWLCREEDYYQEADYNVDCAYYDEHQPPTLERRSGYVLKSEGEDTAEDLTTP